MLCFAPALYAVLCSVNTTRRIFLEAIGSSVLCCARSVLCFARSGSVVWKLFGALALGFLIGLLRLGLLVLLGLRVILGLLRLLRFLVLIGIIVFLGLVRRLLPFIVLLGLLRLRVLLRLLVLHLIVWLHLIVVLHMILLCLLYPPFANNLVASVHRGGNPQGQTSKA